MKAITYFFAASAGALLISSLSGCATMSESECATADWHDIGYKDGQHGKPASYMEERRQDCAKNGFSLNQQQYMAGRSQGITEYCTPENGRSEGRQGHPYLGACPAELEHNFLVNYNSGKRVYTAEQRVDSLDRQTMNLQHKLDKETDNQKRQNLRKELRDLDVQLKHAREDLSDEERRFR